MKSIYLILIILTIFLLVACTENQYSNDINDLLYKINSSRSEMNEVLIDINNIIYKFDEKDMGLSQKEIELLLEYDTSSSNENFFPSKKVTKIQAIEDIELFFEFLKYTYAPYTFFGGDEKFDSAKSEIISKIVELTEDVITAKYLEDMLINHLNFIEDAHFRINEQVLAEPKYYFYNNDIEFEYDINGYFTYTDDIKYYIKNINDDSIFDKYLKLSINEKGDLIYNLGNIQSLNSSTKLKVNLYDDINNEEVAMYVDLKCATYLNVDNKNFSIEIKDNIPIVSIRRMIEDEANNNLSSFVETGDIIKKHPISIIDIRGNTGGKDTFAIEWFVNFSGKKPEKISTTATLYSKVNNYITNKTLENINIDFEYEMLQEMIKDEIDKAKSDINKWDISYGSNKRIQNNNLIFVVIDKLVASSAEVFIEYLYSLDNVILVGTNTGGALRSNSFANGRLYNSKIRFSFGNSLSLYNDEVFSEGIGFQPDIWIGDNTAIEKILLLVN